MVPNIRKFQKYYCSMTYNICIYLELLVQAIAVDSSVFSGLWHQYFDSQALDCRTSQGRY